eukprot:TRINITY_DN540_c0_g1_i1.p1 TRINITY_DN540_c0_g1~~TRINITY_DN540_c0_g1_i1.p1  ORF type:complete len:253 (-),score=38.63 TRINITY_DN540_c0_g1_i1:84-842(-)
MCLVKNLERRSLISVSEPLFVLWVSGCVLVRLGCTGMCFDVLGNIRDPPLSEEEVCGLFKADFDVCMREVDDDRVYRLTAILGVNSQNGFDRYLYLESMPQPPTAPAKVNTVRSERTDPSLKSAEWYRKREILKNDIPQGFEETLLVNHRGFILEGLSSNFAVLIDNKIYTAPPHKALVGTVQSEILKLCEEMNIEVVREAPHIDNLDLFDGAYISSTSRGLLPISHINSTKIDRNDGLLYQLRKYLLERKM